MGGECGRCEGIECMVSEEWKGYGRGQDLPCLIAMRLCRRLSWFVVSTQNLYRED